MPRSPVDPLTLNLPKGGGALRAVGEKLTPVSTRGTVGFSVPVPTPPGRGSLHPDLSLTYSSAAGNSVFGLGWDLGLPSVARKTEKGLPRYLDDDRFVLAGAEDLVPVARPGQGQAPAPFGGTGPATFQTRFRPRTEGAFTRIDRHVIAASGETFWSAVSAQNVLTVFGRTAQARTSDPDDPGRVFEWLIEDVFDDRGNHVHYRYVADDDTGVPTTAAHEVHRSGRQYARRYLKEIAYTVATPVADRFAATPVDHADPGWRAAFQFLVVFDYGDHAEPVSPLPSRPWPARTDAFSSYRSGFEIRTQRRCERILVFHQFPAELGAPARLVSATELAYDGADSPGGPDPAGGPADRLAATLRSVTQAGHHDDGTAQRLPPVSFRYREWSPSAEVRALAQGSYAGLPTGLMPPYQWVDLDADGAAGVLTRAGGGWHYQSNLGAGTLAPPRPVSLPPQLPPGAQPSIGQLFGDHRLTVLVHDGATPRYSVRDLDGERWAPFVPFPRHPSLDWDDPDLRQVDLDGDGLPDVLRTLGDAVEWYPYRGRDGWDTARRVALDPDERRSPTVVLRDARNGVFLADMSGDGLEDLVRVRNGGVCYWPNLGFGRFGPMVTMSGPPSFDPHEDFDPTRVHLVDVDGTGPADLVYVGRRGVSYWPNLAGNRWGREVIITGLPVPDHASSVTFLDLFGTGTQCLVVSSTLPDAAGVSLRYVDLMPDGKPYLLAGVDNHRGLTTEITYGTSTLYALADRRAGRPWRTHLPFPVHVVAAVTTTDQVTGVATTRSYRYRDGYFDVTDREFRGFGYVATADADRYTGLLPVPGGPPAPQPAGPPPVVTATWYHTGADTGPAVDRDVDGLADLVDPTADERTRHELLRCLRGQVLREAVYALDGTPEAAFPYVVTDRTWQARLLADGAGDPDGYAVTLAVPHQTLERHLERQPVPAALRCLDIDLNNPAPAPGPATEPARTVHTFAARVNDFGQVERSVTVGYGRTGPAAAEAQRTTLATATEARFGNAVDQPGWHRVGVPLQERSYEVTGLPPVGESGRFDVATLAGLAAAPVTPAASAVPAPAAPARRKLTVTRSLYWDDDARLELPFGQFSGRALPRRAVAAAFAANHLAEVAAELDAATIVAAGRYEALPDDDGEPLWWLSSTVNQPDPAAFFAPTVTVDPFGLGTFADLDPHALLTEKLLVTRAAAVPGTDRFTVDPTAPRWNVTAAVNDYRTLAPRAVTDPNGVVATVRVDGLGMVTATRLTGTAGEGAPPGEWDHEYLLDLAAWDERGAPTSVRTRSRTSDAAGTAWVESVVYFTGSGAAAQTKAQAEPGPAPYRDAAGTLVADPVTGRPAVRDAPRWIGTGRTVFDGKGRPVRRFDPYFAPDDRYDTEAELVELGFPTTLRYDPADRVTRIDFPDGTYARAEPGIWSSRVFDRNDTVADSVWLAARTAPGASPEDQAAASASLAHAGTPATRRVDALGRVVETAERNGGSDLVTATAYDGAGRVRSVTDPRGVVVETSGYDLLGRPLVVTSPDAGTRRTLPDTLGRPLRTWHGCGPWTPAAAPYEVRVRPVHDLFGRPVQTWVHDTTAGPPPGQPGQPPAPPSPAPGETGEICRAVTGFGDDDPDDGRARYLLGVASQQFDGAGLAETVRRDFRGNVTEARRRFAAGYDREPDWGSVAGAAPTASGRLAAAAATLEAPALGYTTAAVFDALSRPITTTAADGSELAVRYNPSNLVDHLEVTPRGGVARTVVDAVRYDPQRRREKTVYGAPGAQTTVTVDYDERTRRINRIRTVRAVPAGAADSVQDLRYGYDAAGNVLRITDSAQQANFYRNAVVTADRMFGYDDLYQLVRSEGRELAGLNHTTASGDRRPPIRDLPDPNDLTAVTRYVETFAYDPSGNLTELRHRQLVNGPAVEWTRTNVVEAASNRLVSSRVAGASTVAEPVGYDARGNTLAMGGLTFTPGWRGQPVRCVAHGTVTAHYQYGHDGQRVRKVVVKNDGNRLEERRYVGAAEFDTTTVAGGLTEAHETLRVETGTQVAALLERPTVVAGQPKSDGPLTRYQLGDHLGSTTFELDDAWNVLGYEEFHAYGTTAYESSRPGAGISLKRYRFTGRERDDETGLQLHGARYYTPWLARWTTPDPTGLAAGLNLYEYVLNRPVTLVDKLGLTGEDPLPPDPSRQLAKDLRTLASGPSQLAKKILDPAVKGWKEFRIKATDAVFDRHAYDEAKASGLPTVTPNAGLMMTDEIVKRTPEASGNMLMIIAAGAEAAPAVKGRPVAAEAPPVKVDEPPATTQQSPVEPSAAPGNKAVVTENPPVTPSIPKPAPPAAAEIPTIWGKGSAIQGRGAEAALEPVTPGTHFYGNFRRFDRAVYSAEGPSAPALEVGQLKSIDTAGKTYQGAGLARAIEKAAGDIAGVGESTWEGGGHTMTIGPNTRRVLDVAIPDTPLSPTQEAMLVEARTGAASMGVEVRIYRVH